ncbi:uncharacterized protein PRCAT00006406001 [Priceomyces carsonii]|uniref:uncharacterized protein n=1 Tax=Priceomyces carsonii TaxID=28549 RepID=UPI002EDA43D0|nr:unnamed protein product [Priceomyces carsonii]
MSLNQDRHQDRHQDNHQDNHQDMSIENRLYNLFETDILQCVNESKLNYESELVNHYTQKLKLSTLNWWYQKDLVPKRYQFRNQIDSNDEALTKRLELERLSHIINDLNTNIKTVDQITDELQANAKSRLMNVMESCIETMQYDPSQRNFETLERVKTLFKIKLDELLSELTNEFYFIQIKQARLCKNKTEKAIKKLEKFEEAQFHDAIMTTEQSSDHHTPTSLCCHHCVLNKQEYVRNNRPSTRNVKKSNGNNKTNRTRKDNPRSKPPRSSNPRPHQRETSTRTSQKNWLNSLANMQRNQSKANVRESNRGKKQKRKGQRMPMKKFSSRQ